MAEFDWETERERIRKEAIENHEMLHKMYEDDRLSFERKRKEMIEEVINSAKTEEQKNHLREMQRSWDEKMKKAGSNQNRLVLAQYLLSKHVNEVWKPSMEKFNQILKNILQENQLRSIHKRKI